MTKQDSPRGNMRRNGVKNYAVDKWDTTLGLHHMADRISDYYHSQFRADLARFLPRRDVPYFGHSWSHDCRGLENIVGEDRSAFLVCLYFTVLVDQAMHEHFRAHYSRFETLTRYPKFCHGLGQFQKNPRAILAVPIEKGYVEKAVIEALLPSGMQLFVSEVIAFFRDHMPEISAPEFFEKLAFDQDVQIPELFVALDPATKDHIEYKAYRALRKAIDDATANHILQSNK